MKYKDYEDDKIYHRGRDYPAYSERIKMSMCMSGKEIKNWFSEDELKEFPDKDGYMGSLP